MLPVAAMATAALLAAFLQTRPDVDAVAAGLRGRVGAGDLVLATPGTYLQLLAAARPGDGGAHPRAPALGRLVLGGRRLPAGR